MVSGTRALLEKCLTYVEGEQGSGPEGDKVLQNKGNLSVRPSIRRLPVHPFIPPAPC